MGGKKKEPARPKRALYRAYRSTSFDEVVGQEHVTDLLREAVKNGSISHAYLFTGPRGTGKTSVARILAFAVNNLPYSTDASHLDIIEIDAASNRRIDDIRDLREKVHIAPVSASYKVYIIDEAHMLTAESFNALLKTLEEPPAHAIFILATTELNKVPATIVSRTQRFAFRPVATGRVIDHLAHIAEAENIPTDPAALELIAEHGGGSFRDSISLLDQLGGMNQTVTVDLVESVLGRARSADIGDLVTLLSQKDSIGLANRLKELQTSGVSPVTLAEQLTRTILATTSHGKEWYELADRLMNITKAHFPQLLLTSTLLQFAAKPGHKTIASSVTAEKPPVPLEKPVTIAQQPAPKTATTEPPKPASKATSSPGGEFNWDKVLSVAKKREAPLHSVISRATMSYDGQTVTLAFQYALHRKKLEQAQYRTQLARLVEDVCGMCPEIRIESLGAVQLAENEVTRSVADIMGGGEVVNA
ncbi:MAG TPA: DNA polymerase III subunit gamma/tau [Candidatus Saccharibacteria bacterium]|nr:DNA polymerase III subunit gamma/tau [Candidatus Saccharibacteria bacterium]